MSKCLLLKKFSLQKIFICQLCSRRAGQPLLLREHTCQCSIESIFPKVNNIDPAQDFPLEDWPHDYADLASDKAKVRLLTGILSLSEDSDRSQLRMDLVHRICKRHPILEPNNRRLVDVGCFCGQTHTVSILGFLLLKEVVTREQEIILCVERLKARILYD